MGAFISEPQEETQHGGEATWRRAIAGQSVVVDLVRNLGDEGCGHGFRQAHARVASLSHRAS
eukprot:8968548-Alexandrium_andersonii.AAC.1